MSNVGNLKFYRASPTAYSYPFTMSVQYGGSTSSIVLALVDVVALSHARALYTTATILDMLYFVTARATNLTILNSNVLTS